MSASKKSGQLDDQEVLLAEVEGEVVSDSSDDERETLVGEMVPMEGTPWGQLEDESNRWYDLFCRYYLPLGVDRSVRRAYIAYAQVEHPDRLTPEGKIPYQATPRRWLEIATLYNWRERSSAFDRMMNQRILNSVELAYRILEDAAPDAAEALVSALTNARTKVQAANSILDRTGVPVHTKHESVSIKITPDDVRKAREEAEEWEKKNFVQSG